MPIWLTEVSIFERIALSLFKSEVVFVAKLKCVYVFKMSRNLYNDRGRVHSACSFVL